MLSGKHLKAFLQRMGRVLFSVSLELSANELVQRQIQKSNDIRKKQA